MVARSLSKVEAARVKEAARNNRDKAMVGVLLHGGLRIGECCALQVRDLDFEKRSIRVERIVVPVNKTLRGLKKGVRMNQDGEPVPPYKAKRQLALYMPDHSIRKVYPKDLGDVLENELQGTKEFVRVGTKASGEAGRAVVLVGREESLDQLWTRLEAEAAGQDRRDWLWQANPQGAHNQNSWDGRLSYPAARQAVTRAMERAGVPEDRRNPHVLRHTWATLWVAGGGDLRTLMQLGGWSNISQLQVYVNLAREQLGERAVKVDLGI